MRTLKTGDPCPCCGRPIRYTDPDALRMLAMLADLLGLPEEKEEDYADDQSSPRPMRRGGRGIWPHSGRKKTGPASAYKEQPGGGLRGRSREAPAVVIDLDALELPDCAGCGDKTKRVRCRTMDLDGPGRAGAIYTCRNVRCRQRREVIGRYFLRREMYGDH